MVLQGWLLQHGEHAQYVAYFGALALMLGWERVRSARQPRAPVGARWRTNLLLTGASIVVLGALPVSFMVAADYAAARGVGLMNAVTLSLWPTLLAGLLARGFISWVTHLLMHKVPLLWRVHRVHHTDVDLDVSTTVRFHPLEFPIGLTVGLPLVAAFGLPKWTLLAYEILDAAVTVFSHANVALPAWLDSRLRLLFVTPSLHRVHHSTHPEEADSNFGAVFPLWDLVFGTFRAAPREPPRTMPLGLHEVRDARSWSLTWLLAVPFFSTLRPTAPTPRAASGGGYQ